MSIWDDTRADWNASRGRSMYPAPAATRDEFFNHYDGSTPLGLADEDHAVCLAKVKQFQTFHMGPSRGWSDIGYNGLVCQHGRAIEGRGLDYVGAHCPNHNARGYGIQFMLGGDEEPTQAAKDRMRRLYDDCSARSGRSLAKRGHRDGIATTCPGDNVYAWVEAGMPAGAGGGAQSSEPKPRSSKTGKEFVPVWTPTGSMTVKQIQTVVGVTADGLYGKGTQAAVAAYQRALGVAADGLWGTDTEAAHLNKAKRVSLVVDGELGPVTRKALQKAVGVKADGIWGPATRTALQKHLGVKADGLIGPVTVKALQRKVGSPADGHWGPATTKALQRALNRGRF